MRSPPDPRLSRAQARAVGQGRFYDPDFRCTRGHADIWRYTANGNCCQCVAERKDPARQADDWRRSGAAEKRRERRARQLARVRLPIERLRRDLAALRQHRRPGETLAATLARLAGFPSA